MKAIILAGGEGTRLRPLTATRPKPLAPLLDKPIVDYTMDLIEKYGIEQAVFTLGYMSGAIKKHFKERNGWNVKISFSEPKDRLGTAGSVKYALNECAEPIIVLSGDGITDIEIDDVVKAHKKNGASATIVLKQVDDPTEYGVVLLDENSMIERFIEKPERQEVFSDLANTGIYILEPDAIELIGEGEFDFSKDLFPLMMKKGMKIYGYKTNAYWCDIGNTDEYRRAQKDMLDGKLSFTIAAKKSAAGYIDETAVISCDAELESPCFIGAGAVIGSNARIEKYSVISSGACIGRNASIKRSIVLENARIEDGAKLRESIVCENARVGMDAELYSSSVIGAGAEIGANTTIKPNVSVWPQKRVETGACCMQSVIWSDGAKRMELIAGKARGAGGILTPETALRLGAAFAKGRKLPAKLLICSDGTPQAVMLDHAIASGIVSVGADAYMALPSSRSVASYTVEKANYSGGIYVETNERDEAVMQFFDENGIELSSGEMRKINQSFLLGELQPFRGRELGFISEVRGMEEAYETHLLVSVESKALKNAPKTLRLSAASQQTRILAGVLIQFGWEVQQVKDKEKLIAPIEDDVLSVHIDGEGRVSLATKEAAADAQMVLSILALDEKRRSGELRAVLPASLHEAYVEHLIENGIVIIRAKNDMNDLIKQSRMLGVCEFMYESELAVMRLARLFAEGRLDEEIKKLPVVFTKESSIDMSWRDTGRVLRSILENETRENAELIDGLKLKHDTGWVVITPSHGACASFRVIAGSMKSEYADDLLSAYVERIRELNKHNE